MISLSWIDNQLLTQAKEKRYASLNILSPYEWSFIMKNLFMDTNIWLSLYTLSDDNLAQFGKLEEMLGKSVNLIVPQQVRDELFRNREGKLKEALDLFQFKAPLYPVFTQGYEEYATISQSIKEASKQFNAWKSKIQTDIKTYSLPADHTIEKLLKKVTILPCNSYVDNAYFRYRIGNPPGKDNKYGDAINWECLLSSIPDGEDLFFISSDQDYRSALESNDMNPFLVEEWSTKKQSSIHFYTRLVHFLNEHIKEIEIQSENEENQLISQLLQSYNFSQTHYLISLLCNYSIIWNSS